MTLDFTTSFIKLNNQYTIVGSAEGVDPTTKPKKGELYFMPEENGERTCKIGDGETELQHLPTIGVSSLGLEATPDTADITLDYNSKYKLSVGNKDIVFKMPSGDGTGHTHDTSNITALTSYSKPSSTGALAATDTLNTALGKLEKALDGKAPTSHATTETTYGAASISNYGHAKLSSSISSTSEDLAATPKAVKTAYDLAAAAVPKSGGTMTGALTLPGSKYFSISNSNTTRNCAINLKNSDIIGINGLYFEDAVDSAGEGINFYRSGTFSTTTTNLKVDRLFGYGGVLYWDPNKGIDDFTQGAGAGDSREILTYGRGSSLYYGATVSRSANTVLAAPNGSAGNATFRKLVAADIPNLDADKITSGTLPMIRGGTGTTTNAGLTSKVLTGGWVVSAIKATTVSIDVSLSSVSTSSYTSFSITVKGIILGTTAVPTDSAGALTFNGVTLTHNTNGTCTVAVKAKKKSGAMYDPNTTINISVISIPMTT